MKTEKANALSTSLIAFVTIIGFMVGFYYNLRSSNMRIFYILVFELLFMVGTFSLFIWCNKKIENE